MKLPELVVPELAEGSKGRIDKVIFRSLSLDSPEPVEGSKGRRALEFIFYHHLDPELLPKSKIENRKSFFTPERC